MRRRGKANQKKEKFIMLLSSVFVLSALTLTGIYVKERTKIENNNTVDFSKLESAPGEKTNEIADNTVIEEEPATQANAATAVNPSAKEAALKDRYQYSGVPVIQETEDEKNITADTDLLPVPDEEPQAQETATPAWTLQFGEEEALVWPIVGNVLINYSMDKTVYFATLDQYRYSPALVIAATEGERITSAADGKVSQVYTDAKLGGCVKMELGDGYELLYGQLSDITVKEGDYVKAGDLLGVVGTPSKYYSVEGANVYFEMTKNGEPINPLNRMS